MSDNNINWKEMFEQDLPEDLLEELNRPTAPPDIDPGETFPIDASFFDASESPHSLTDTNVIPKEVQNVAAYTSNQANTWDPTADAQPETDGFVLDMAEFQDENESPGIDDTDDDYDDRRHRPIRRVRRKRTGLLGGVMYAAFILGLATILAFLAWMVADDVLALTKEEIPVEITIPENFTIDDVANELHAQGLINHRFLFRWFSRLFNAYDRIQPGVYQVIPADFNALIGSMNQRTGAMIEVRVMIPEGRTSLEVFHILEENGVSTVEQLMYAAENGTFDFPFLDGIPLDAMNRLEGYLFPDTYVFFKHQNPESVIRRMLENFHIRMEQNDIYELVENSPFTLHEIVNIAAMIEKEIASVAEAPRISSVIHNRLAQGMRLEIDATLQFILGQERREVLLASDRWIESPYNTYLVEGLPYGPIGNPGVASILAALQPESTNFIFYALHRDGHHEFFPNYAMHHAFVNSPDFVHYEQLRNS